MTFWDWFLKGIEMSWWLIGLALVVIIALPLYGLLASLIGRVLYGGKDDEDEETEDNDGESV